ncbi:metal-dependent hydrolase (plasmid) [Pontibacillus sp. ALD_SL1]|uniref:metal-dependent hydrolase n=1 Tax=Pontibacillus sp. ALD_SL1 TaxID=2777185 RepID=UPI001A969611|nr:metal-dependent hydrolase [Pontibacillus sp. ALD_SL1]QST02969.1 metal-dependent hydrolase [Pontibacillus sp. ALD_SL1]
MLAKTHVATSVLGSLALVDVLGGDHTLLLYSGVMLGALLPDIDEPKSYIGQRVPIIPHMIKKIFKHRGITHSFLMMAAFLIWALIEGHAFLWGLALGVTGHIIGDLFSKTGVPLLWFFWKSSKKRIRIPIYTTGSFLEQIILMGSIIGIAGYLWNNLI